MTKRPKPKQKVLITKIGDSWFVKRVPSYKLQSPYFVACFGIPDFRKKEVEDFVQKSNKFELA